MRIFVFHLLNDFSGSPKVLMQLTKIWQKNGDEVHLYTSLSRCGFLSDIEGVIYHDAWYKFSENRFTRLIFYTCSQILLFLKIFWKLKKGDLVYVNTVLPFGAALCGKIKGCRIVYHLHETTVNPPILKKFLFGVVKFTADDIVYVSKYVAECQPFENKKTYILYNAIEETFLQKAAQMKMQKTVVENVLMACSLKAYKGVNGFVQLAADNPHFKFRLIVNADAREISTFFRDKTMPDNLQILDSQADMLPHYQWADLILNLSRLDGWIETFGLTIIEGMAFGLPAIVPPKGGVVELVEENKNGLRVDSRNRNALNNAINKILGDRALYEQMSKEATAKIIQFNEASFARKCLEISHEKK